MGMVIFDFEVFAHEWLVVLKDISTGYYTEIYCDNEAFKQAIDEDTIYVGFNSKHYDRYIAKAVACDFTPDEVKEVNDFIIKKHRQGWEYPGFNGMYWSMNDVDIMDDMQQGLSLKAIEGHLGMNIKESEINFDIDRYLTPEEIKRTFEYCRHDVDATEEIVKLRKDYLQNKINIGKLAGITPEKAMSMTNAKLTAAMLKAEAKPHDDEREYQYPDNLLRQYIPPEVFEFFDRLHDTSIPSEIIFKEKLEIVVGECPTKIAYGGIHGARRNYFFEEKSEGRKRITENDDVGSYYPHLIIINGYASRNIPDPGIFKNVVETRMRAKAEGDKATANALKLVANTTYGASLNQYNDLYDPLMGRSVCISGQLYLLELAEHLVADIEDLTITQLNTDGIMFEFYEDQQAEVDVILKEWQDRTGFTLEPDKIAKIFQKDVNNYLEVQRDGSVKSKGGYLVKGIAPAGAFNINNNAVIVATAIKEYFLNRTPVEETIGNCNDVFQYQMIAKAGVKYREAYHLIDGEKEPVQKVNRVYATADERYGKLYKVKAEDDSEAKIDSLPEHCIIDNDNQITMDDIDKTFYIDMAKKRINDFKGIQPEKPKTNRRKKDMAKKETAEITKAAEDFSSLNVHQKLIKARMKFLSHGVTKSGKHMELRYKYFELDDIVPIATEIFAEIGLLPVVSFTEELATMNIINTDNPDQTISFTTPMRFPIENKMVNPVQSLGSAQTYLRRYLYFLALDICEPDQLEASTEDPKEVEKKQKAPATTEEREEIKEELTTPEDNATELQIKGLKKVCKKLLEVKPEMKEVVSKLAEQTVGFTEISKSSCEQVIEKFTEIIEKEEDLPFPAKDTEEEESNE